MERAATARLARMLKETQSAATRLAMADQARAEGDIETAANIYVSLAKSRFPTSATPEAWNRLTALEQEGRSKLTQLESRCTDVYGVSASEQSIDESLVRLAECVTEFKQLEKQYRRVPKVGTEIQAAFRKQKQQPRVKAAMNEPEAARLWQQGQQLEQEGQVCCAFLIYEKALGELPAPSAALAEQRLNELRTDSQQVAAAEACRTMQWCHQNYRLAMLVVRERPEKARDLFRQIVERAPADSEVHKAAQAELARL